MNPFQFPAGSGRQEHVPSIVPLIYGELAVFWVSHCDWRNASQEISHSAKKVPRNFITPVENHSMGVVSKVKFSRRIEWRYFQSDPSTT
jgi:hypothetical protein